MKCYQLTRRRQQNYTLARFRGTEVILFTNLVVRCQATSYAVSLPFGWYQIMLLGKKYKHVNNSQVVKWKYKFLDHEYSALTTVPQGTYTSQLSQYPEALKRKLNYMPLIPI